MNQMTAWFQQYAKNLLHFFTEKYRAATIMVVQKGSQKGLAELCQVNVCPIVTSLHKTSCHQSSYSKPLTLVVLGDSPPNLNTYLINKP